jgi:hypothetical protein
MRYNRIGKDLFLDDIVSAYKQAKTNLSNSNNPLSHSDLQALSNAIDHPINNAKEAEKMLSSLSEDVIAENFTSWLNSFVGLLCLRCHKTSGMEALANTLLFTPKGRESSL